MSAWVKLGEKGKPFPASVRALDGKSGVYAIRTVGWLFSTVVYVGESHTGNLYKTLTRHFQSWRRSKQWWRGAYAPAATDPGHTYERAGCEVSFETCKADAAVEMQWAWVKRLSPRDNVARPDEGEEAPF